VNEKYTDNILKELRQNWGIEAEDFIAAKPYTDHFYAAYFDQRLNKKFQLDIAKIDEMLADQFYFYTFFYDEMVRIASTKFLNFVYSTFDAKIKAMNSKEDDGSGMKQRKLIYISAHDSTLAAMLSGIEQKQKLQPFYASHILIELWQKSGTAGDKPEDFYVKWIYNDESLKVVDGCDNGNCPYPEFKEFLQAREYQGDWEAA
jgi:hypothetical protein